jgi:hypothetical protein
MYEERESIPWQKRQQAFEHWTGHGLVKRHAYALVNAGYATLDDLREAADPNFPYLAHIGPNGLLAIYRLMGRQPPTKLKSTDEIRTEFEQAWRTHVGQERLDNLADLIIDEAGDALDKANHKAAQAMWEMARRRRSKRMPAGETGTTAADGQ